MQREEKIRLINVSQTDSREHVPYFLVIKDTPGNNRFFSEIRSADIIR